MSIRIQYAYDALERGEIDAFVNYLPTIMILIDEGRPFKIVGNPLYRVPQAIAIEPGDPELAEAVAKIVDDMHRDGTLKRLSEKWFGLDMTVLAR